MFHRTTLMLNLERNAGSRAYGAFLNFIAPTSLPKFHAVVISHSNHPLGSFHVLFETIRITKLARLIMLRVLTEHSLL